MDLTSLKNLFHAGYPLWTLVGGGVFTLFIESLFPRRLGKGVFVTGLLVMTLSLYLAFRQWLTGDMGAQDLFIADRLTLFVMVVVLIAGILSLLNLYPFLVAHKFVSADMVPLLLLSVSGMIFMFASDHLIVNFIGLETMSLGIYVMVGSNKDDHYSAEGAFKYFVLGSVASAIFLYGIALMYASFSTFRLTELAQMQLYPGLNFLPRLALVLILSGFFFKLALFPFHFWVPDVYEGAPAPVTGLMSTAVKAAALALFIRLLQALNYFPEGVVPTLLFASVIGTLLVGNLGALVQDNVKRMLAYSSIAHAGYLVLGLYAGYKGNQFDSEVVASVMFYLVGYTFTTLGAFAVLSHLVDDKKEVAQYADLHGLGYKRPVLAAVFALFMLSLLGMPPTVGFAAKFGIFSYAVKNGHMGLAILGLVTSVVSAYYYLRPVVVMYFKGMPEKPKSFLEAPVSFALMLSLVFCTLAVLYLGIKADKYLPAAEMVGQMLKGK